MDVSEAIRKRRSIRSYKSREIPEEVLRRVLEAARLAPSARNRQEWKFVVVREPALRRKLVSAAKGQSFVGTAPVVLVFCATEDSDIMACGQKTGSVDTSIALSYVTLAAVEEGLGTCWLGAFQEDEVKQILNIPAQARVVAMSPLGYPAEQPVARGRKDFDKVVSFDGW